MKDLTDDMKVIRRLYDELEDALLYYDSAMSEVDKAITWFKIADITQDVMERMTLLKAKATANGREALQQVAMTEYKTRP
jgi:vacuolar-type H+-ATPase catalytic subunit A/Vma1